MNNKAKTMDVQDIILSEVRELRVEFKAHTKDETEEFVKIRAEISDLKVQDAIGKHHRGMMSAGVSAMIAGCVAWVVLFFNRPQ